MQGYLERLLCFEGEGAVNLFPPPVVGQEGVADDSGAGKAGVKVESDLVSGMTEEINFKPKTAKERGGGAAPLDLESRGAASGLWPYMLVLELVSPLTTTLQPGHIPSGYRASNCQQGGDGETWQGGELRVNGSSLNTSLSLSSSSLFSPLTHRHALKPLLFSDS